MRGFKQLNEYAIQVGMDVYEACPKAVFAAIAVSALTLGGDYLEDARARLLEEWRVLHENGIVPQPPPRATTRQNESPAPSVPDNAL